LVQGNLSEAERTELFEGIRREALESSQKIELLNGELQAVLSSKASFVRHRPLYECSCGPLGQDIRGVCSICGVTPPDHPKSISSIDPDLDRIIGANIWLELGIARVFDAQGFVTYVGSRPIGLSGASQEVDVLAWDPDVRHLLLTEVTTEAASMDRLGKVLLRREDIPVHASALVTLGPAAEGVLDYGRRHNIGVIPQVRDNIEQLTKWIESTRRGLGNHPKK
jgi:hypothetical protein